MFGVDEEHLAEAEARLVRRRRRRKRWLLTFAELCVLVPLVVVTGAVWLVLTPDGIAKIVERYGSNDDRSFSITDAVIHPGSQWNDPATWKIILHDVDVIPHESGRPTLHIECVVFTMPDPAALWYRREAVVNEAWLIGLRIQAKQQKSAPKPERRPNAIQLLKADFVHVWDASYDAPADGPLPPAGVSGIYGSLAPVVYDPFTREPTGIATLQAQRFHTGTLMLTGVRIGRIVADKGDLVLEDGVVVWEGQRARVHGTITNIDARSRVDLQVRLRNARVERLVSNATGQPSPIRGLTDVDLSVHSGGNLPRGGGYMDAHVQITDAIIPLPPGTRGIYKDVIRLVPIARLDDQDQVHLDAMVGDLTLSRGVVKLHELLYDTKIPVLIRGTIDAVEMDLYVRFVLGGDPETNPGRGLRLKGPLAAPQASWATRDELLPGWRELREERREEKRIEREERRLAGKVPKWMVSKRKQQEALESQEGEVIPNP